MDYKHIEELVYLAKLGDYEAKEKLAEEFKPMILNISKKTFTDGYDFYDIKNECYAILFKCISYYTQSRHRFVAYATNAIKNEINDLSNKNKKRSSAEGSDALTLSDNLEYVLRSNEPTPDEILYKNDEINNLKLALSKLDDDEKDLIDFILIQNNPLIRYSEITKIPYTTLQRKKKKTLNKLSQYLN
ncbi:sigma-70 family RNA polymerase sigma factor [uncultured Clostridium sp.]|uniref:sigma-70 family RNA polymerase sigma factor n=1 Tax=uncultured Clostridium sp. TaxID=59620 RepID=UPI0028ED847F|nr:sigma-70 family RNA polymerase sigma factor [uncultured Clostridium sp.]